jgi:hypothetical protein
MDTADSLALSRVAAKPRFSVPSVTLTGTVTSCAASLPTRAKMSRPLTTDRPSAVMPKLRRLAPL